jgi:hypothetical protein
MPFGDTVERVGFLVLFHKFWRLFHFAGVLACRSLKFSKSTLQ